MKTTFSDIPGKVMLLTGVLITLLTACTEKEDKAAQTIQADAITIGQDVVEVSLSSVKSFTFTVSPADARFIYDVSSADCQIHLYPIGPDGSPEGRNPEFFRLQSVTEDDVAQGRYKAVILDLNKDRNYEEEVVLEIRYEEEGLESKVIRSKPFTVRFTRSYGKEMVSMSITKELNGTGVLETIHLERSGQGFSVSSALISSPDLILTFESDGAKVLVDGVEQVSGKTMNNFSKPLAYRVEDGQGGYSDYIVTIVHSGLPVLFIETPGHATIPDKHSDWLADTKMTLYNPDWTIDYEGTTGIRGRGNSTWGYPKKPYALKLDSKAEILGMPKHKRWVLLANWLDRTLLRNATAFKIATMTGLAYTPRGQFVDVYLNGKHNGCYLLCEHIKVDENRVNIDELEDDKTDSGYIMELDSYFDEVHKFRSEHFNMPYMFKDPDEVNQAQFAFIQDYVNNMEASLKDDARFAAREYAEYIDVDSFIDYWFVQELTGNEEAKHPKSTYMHKDAGGRLTMGPVWDFDWETFTPINAFRDIRHLYYGRLFEDPVFKARAKERWNMLKDEFRKIPEFIDSEAERIRSSESMNHILWPVTSNVNKDISLSFDAAVVKMKNSYTDKLNWMDQTISQW